jgi:cytochrome c-type biogenesis protein CcmF
MPSNLGFASLLLTFSIAIFLPFFAFFSRKKFKHEELARVTKYLTFATFIAAIFTQACLIFCFVSSDFSNLNVYQNSHQLKPLIYKISGSWGNHEGSMLLLISIVCAYSSAFVFLSKIDDKNKIIIACTQSAIVACFAAFSAFASNPFATIFPAPLEGLGLNPILQDIGLALHPPMLYTGYIGFSLPFSFAIAALLNEKIDAKFAQKLQPWLFFSYAFLTAGIGLGSWWAYRELGWGGYWFWDPVENVSLMPWIAATALIHASMMLKRQGIFKIWNILLPILTFILCLLGLFLVRSGILTSVHSFAVDANRGFFVIALIALLGGAALTIFAYKISAIKSEKIALKFWSKAGLILVNNYMLILALFVVFLGTTYPIFLRAFDGKFISIGSAYYNKIFSFLLLPFLIFLTISTDFHKKLKWQQAVLTLSAAAFTSLIFLYSEKCSVLEIVILFLAIFAALSSLIFSKNFCSKIAHFGFCLGIIGVILSSSFGLAKELNIKKGESFSFANFEINFAEIEHLQGKNFIARQGDFLISKNQQRLFALQPQLRFYPVSQQITNETSIKHLFFGDLYLVIGTKDEQENFALRAYFKPFVWLIWLGFALIFFGVISQILFRKNKTHHS